MCEIIRYNKRKRDNMTCEHEWKGVWLTEELEGYRCQKCNHETLDQPIYTKEDMDKEWNFHQSFLVEICSIFKLDFCVENETSILKRLREMKDWYEIDLDD